MERYAGFFEVSSKEAKEKIVALEWLNALPERNLYLEETLRNVEDQWPDCEINTQAGELVGIEITELVCSEAIKANKKGRNVYRAWEDREIISEVIRLVNKKDTRSHGGKYKKLILIIHSDEWLVNREKISGIRIGKLTNIDEVYVILSYDPATRSYPLVNLTERG